MTTTKEKILAVIDSNPSNMIYYSPNVSVWAQTGVVETKKVMEDLVAEGLLEELKIPRYKGEVMSEYAVLSTQEFDWENMADPDDFMPIEKHDVEEVKAYRPSWKLRHKKAMKDAKDGEHAWFKFKEDKYNCCAKCGIIQRKDGKNKACPGIVKVTLR